MKFHMDNAEVYANWFEGGQVLSKSGGRGADLQIWSTRVWKFLKKSPKFDLWFDWKKILHIDSPYNSLQKVRLHVWVISINLRDIWTKVKFWPIFGYVFFKFFELGGHNLSPTIFLKYSLDSVQNSKQFSCKNHIPVWFR